MQNEFMTIGQVADRIGCCRQTVWRWVRDGEFPAPAIKIGQRFSRWRTEDVERFLNQKSPSTPADINQECEV